MFFVCHPIIEKLKKTETENNAYAKLWDDNKEHYRYGMLWYFLEWSIGMDTKQGVRIEGAV